MKAYHASINNDIVDLIPKEAVVLDIGCADGKLGGFLKEKKDCVVFGIEKNRASAKKAKKTLDKVFCIDLEKTKPKIKAGTIDMIVFADVLEHLKNPGRVLEKYSVFLKPVGKIIVSVPNIANFFIRKDLLSGKFDYADSGILDKNHLRFFTLKTIKETLQTSGFRILKVKATRNALRNMRMQKIFHKIGFGKVYNLLDYSLANCWKSLFAQQFVILAEKVK